ncbi:MAG: 30S ribosome-binding factor RbfA [Deltaproteobacteria bacterium]|jgi:ribosome-binding factor A|nr:30S ribosome-binding factor RbfA [Deltaproteobacteria bacterium]
MNRRLEKINRQLMAQVSELLLFRSSDPRLQTVTVTRALASPDLKKARIFYSVLGGPQVQAEAAEALKKASGYIRSHLAASLDLRAMPALTFTYDPNMEYAQHISDLLLSLAVPGAPREPDPAPVRESKPRLEPVGDDYVFLASRKSPEEKEGGSS